MTGQRQRSKLVPLRLETINLDPDVSEAIDMLAEAYGMSRKQLISRIIREHLEALGAINGQLELAEDSPVDGEA